MSSEYDFGARCLCPEARKRTCADSNLGIQPFMFPAARHPRLVL